MNVRETVLALIEEEHQFGVRTDEWLDKCAEWVREVFELVDAVSRDPMADDELARKAIKLIERAREHEERAF